MIRTIEEIISKKFEFVDADDWEYILKELEEVKSQRDDLAIKNINLERENVRLTEKIKIFDWE